jgi:hypothetical protein
LLILKGVTEHERVHIICRTAGMQEKSMLEHIKKGAGFKPAPALFA